MNYEEASDDDDNDDEDRGSSLSPNTESTRPASASSIKSSTVRLITLYTHKFTHTGCCCPDVFWHCISVIIRSVWLWRHPRQKAPPSRWTIWRNLYCDRPHVALQQNAVSHVIRREWTVACTPLTSCTWRGKTARRLECAEYLGIDIACLHSISNVQLNFQHLE